MLIATDDGNSTPNQVKGEPIQYCGRLYGEPCRLTRGLCWSCNQDYAGYTCSKCPEPHKPTEGDLDFCATDHWDPDAQQVVWKLHGWATNRCQPCNREYSRYKRYAKIWERLTDWCDLGLSARLTTFTTRSTHLKHADREMHCRDLWEHIKRLYRTKPWKYCEGLIGVAEATSKRDDDTCHPHIHAITLWSKRPNYKVIHSSMMSDNLDYDPTAEPSDNQDYPDIQIQNIDWMPKKNKSLYMTAAMRKYLKKYFQKDPIPLGGSIERPRYWLTLGLPRRDPSRFMKEGEK